MIVDCYSHIWDTPEQFAGTGRLGAAAPVFPPIDPDDLLVATPTRHAAVCESVACSLVIGYRADHLGAHVSNDKIADYVRTRPARLIGIAGIDLGKPRDAVDEVSRASDELGLRGVAVAPAAQNVHPSDSQAMVVYAHAAERKLPVFFHVGIAWAAGTRMEYAQPMLLDEVARELPELRIVVCHMGLPWVDETCLLLAKHRNVYAEISWLSLQPWTAYQAMLSAFKYGVMEQLLFGSGFPVATPADAVDSLFGVNHLTAGTNLPAIPREMLRGIVERDALSLLGLTESAESVV